MDEKRRSAADGRGRLSLVLGRDRGASIFPVKRTTGLIYARWLARTIVDRLMGEAEGET